MPRQLITLIAVLLLSAALHAAEPADTLATEGRRSSTAWLKQLWDNGFHINDPGIDYPAFPRFALKVYNWGDSVFNSYDPEYVVATGKNWKLQARSYNWLQTYAFIFPKGDVLRMRTGLYADVGANLSFMAVSLSYMLNANKLLSHNHEYRANFNLNFTCSRFNIDYTRTLTEGGVTITQMPGKSYWTTHRASMDGVKNTTDILTANYFFNHNRYSHAAAHCFSKYQLRSAGTWIAGFTYQEQDISIDFTELINNTPNPLTDLEPYYRFHYRDYMLTGGYGYNLVLKPRRWLLNFMGTLSAGYKYSNSDSTIGHRDMVATSGTASFASVYNHRALFIGLSVKAHGWVMFNAKTNFATSLIQIHATVGMRF